MKLFSYESALHLRRLSRDFALTLVSTVLFFSLYSTGILGLFESCRSQCFTYLGCEDFILLTNIDDLKKKVLFSIKAIFFGADP